MSEPATPDNAAAAPPERSSGRDPLPQHTTPTWEVELLISGVTVFAMLQLPGWLDDRYFDLLPRLASDWRQTLLIGYLYLRITTLILAVTFVLHLLSRAHWIALVGLDSVYPQGIRWDRLMLGPITRKLMQQRLGSMADTIERADNRATIVFATGVQLAMLTFKLVVLVAVVAGAVLAVGLMFSVPAGGTLVILICAAILFPLISALLLDRRIGPRLAPSGRVARCLDAVIRIYAACGFGHSSSPGMLLLNSQRSHQQSQFAFGGILLLAIALTAVQTTASRHPFDFGAYPAIVDAERDAGDVLRADHYDDQRDGQRLTTTPFIPSQVIADPWLRLTIPMDPTVQNIALQRRCPAALHPASDETAQRRAILACFVAIHPLLLDGHSVRVPFDLGSDPKARRPAVVAMIDVRALANGRHELQVGQPADTDGKLRDPDVIAFWR